VRACRSRLRRLSDVVRFWQEWSSSGRRWRGCIEHVQSGEWGTFLDLAAMVDFLRCFGVIGGEGDLPVTAEVHRCLRTREEDRKSIYFPNRIALCGAERAGGCQGCRAKATLERNPGLIDLFLGFWGRADAWPQSPSWTGGICAHDGPDRESRTRRAPPSIEEEEAA
jgi:hypothetical protein